MLYGMGTNIEGDQIGQSLATRAGSATLNMLAKKFSCQSFMGYLPAAKVFRCQGSLERTSVLIILQIAKPIYLKLLRNRGALLNSSASA
jgi:hypothetical protein